MKKTFLTTIAAILVVLAFAQDSPADNKKNHRINLAGRSNDHFLIQFGWHGWADMPDSIATKGFSRTFNFYVMLDFPFKTDPRFSVALGPGVGTDHMYFDKTNVTIADHTGNLRFQNLKDTNHFEKFKLTTAYLEVPVELRFSSNPLEAGKSFKVAVGMKVGLLVDAHTKGKNWVDKSGKTILGFDDKFIQKQKDKTFFNNNRLAAIARIGYGHFTLFGSYQLGAFIKEGFGPDVRPLSIGLTLSGL